MALPNDLLKTDRANTKQARLIRLLTRNGGASISELVSETGWKANSVHAALSTLRGQGACVDAPLIDGVRRYRLLPES